MAINTITSSNIPSLPTLGDIIKDHLLQINWAEKAARQTNFIGEFDPGSG
ncbi:hypothetical protein bcgnr5373_59090 [Bacillus cereus]